MKCVHLILHIIDIQTSTGLLFQDAIIIPIKSEVMVIITLAKLGKEVLPPN